MVIITGVVIFLIIMSNLTESPTLADNIFFIIFGLGILGFAVVQLRKMYTNYRVGKPEVLISKTTAVLGDKIHVDFSNTFRQSVNVQKMSAKLIFKESATYQQGTNTRTVHHDEVIQEFETMGGQFRPNSFYSEQFEFQIPRDHMHTLNVNRNRLRWLIQLEMEIPRMANFNQEYEINVLPELTKAAEF